MKRQIKFRAKTTANGHWVYGSLIDYDNGTFAIRNRKSEPWIAPDTIGQYIGLKDRNGKEIYEGDILHQEWRYIQHHHDPISYTSEHSGYVIGKVCYERDSGFYLKGISFNHDNDDKVLNARRRIASYRSEVIGNIYDNPEKLEV